MIALLEQLDAPFLWVVQTSWRASVLAGLVLLSQWIFRRWLSPRWMYRLWFIPLLCLLIPSAPQSNISIFNLLGTPAYIAQQPAQPAVKSAGPGIETKISHTLLPVAAKAPPARLFRVVMALQMIWFAGFLLLLLRFLFSNLAFSASIARIRPSGDPVLLGLLEECKRVMGVHARVTLIKAPQICSPVLMGVFRPKLLLPRNPPEPFSHQELRFVFLHELAHLKQGDIAINWITTFAQTLHWFNPVVWFALSRMRAEREVARDHLAISYAGGKRNQSYGLTILKILQNLPPRPRALAALSGMLETKYQLKHRFLMIAGFRRTHPAWAALSAILVSALAVSGLTVAEERPPLAPEPPSESVEAAKQRRTVALWLEGKTKRKLSMIRLPDMRFQDTPIEKAVCWISSAAAECDPEGQGVSIYVLAGVNQTISIDLSNKTLEEALQALSAAGALRCTIDEFQECVLLEPESSAKEEFGDSDELPGYAAEFPADEFLEQSVGFPAGLSTTYVSDERAIIEAFPRHGKLKSLFADEEKPEPPKSILTNRSLSNQPKKIPPHPWPTVPW